MPAALEVRNLVKTYSTTGNGWTRRPRVHAVDGVSFEVRRGEVFGLVGESGCGKSTVARCIMRLLEPDSGEVLLDGKEAGALLDRAPKTFRRHVQMIFQDPYSSLNPRRRIGDTIAEPMIIEGRHHRDEISRRVARLLDEVRLPAEAASRYPHEFSGGQRQRIAIARALALEPSVLVADEPVSSLDVSVQSQILVLLEELRQARGLSLLFISHDLAVVRNFCQRMAVMYLGRIVEQGSAAEVLDNPSHPYTLALRSATVVPDASARSALARIEGEIPSPLDPPPGCHFHPRCRVAEARCATESPPWRTLGPDRGASCHLIPDPSAVPRPYRGGPDAH